MEHGGAGARAAVVPVHTEGRCSCKEYVLNTTARVLALYQWSQFPSRAIFLPVDKVDSHLVPVTRITWIPFCDCPHTSPNQAVNSLLLLSAVAEDLWQSLSCHHISLPTLSSVLLGLPNVLKMMPCYSTVPTPISFPVLLPLSLDICFLVTSIGLVPEGVETTCFCFVPGGGAEGQAKCQG